MNTNYYPTALFLHSGNVLLISDRWGGPAVRLRSGCRHEWNPQLPSHREIAWRGCFIVPSPHPRWIGEPPEYSEHDREFLAHLGQELNLTWRGESPCYVEQFLASLALYESTPRGPWRLRTHAMQKLLRGIVHAARPPVAVLPLAKEPAHAGD